MADMSPATFEQRLAVLEGELRKANARVRALEEWRRRTARGCVLMVGGLAALLLVFGRVVPTPGATRETRVTAPFYVVNAANQILFDVHEVKDDKGGAMTIYNATGVKVGQMNAQRGNGVLVLVSADQRYKAAAGIEADGTPVFELGENDAFLAKMGIGTTGGGGLTLLSPKTGNTRVFLAASGPRVELNAGDKKLAEIAFGTGDNGMGLRIWNSRGGAQVISLGTYKENGFFTLGNRAGTPTLEAGTIHGDTGSIRLYGPSGECRGLQAVANLPPCMVVGR